MLPAVRLGLGLRRISSKPKCTNKRYQGDSTPFVGQKSRGVGMEKGGYGYPLGLLSEMDLWHNWHFFITVVIEQTKNVQCFLQFQVNNKSHVGASTPIIGQKSLGGWVERKQRMVFFLGLLSEMDLNPIHPFSAAYPGLDHGGIRLSNETQTFFSPAMLISSSWGIPRHSQARRDM